jgi:hypothetical protein
MPMTASESPALPCPALLLNITGLDVGKSAAYDRASAGDIQGFRTMKSRLFMQLPAINCLPTNQVVCAT